MRTNEIVLYQEIRATDGSCFRIKRVFNADWPKIVTDERVESIEVSLLGNESRHRWNGGRRQMEQGKYMTRDWRIAA